MRNVLTKDLGWKLISLALAVVIWYTVRALSRDEIKPAKPLESWATRTFSDLSVVPLSATKDVRAFKVNPTAVQVTVSGRPEVVSAMDRNEVRVTVDLTGIEASGDLIKNVDVSVPLGVTVVHIMPTEVSVIVPPNRKKQDEQTETNLRD
jgi:hypothetical protein